MQPMNKRGAAPPLELLPAMARAAAVLGAVHRRRLGTARDRPEMALNPLVCHVDVHVADDGEDRIVRHVIGLEEGPDVVQGCCLELFHGSKDEW